MMLKRNTTDKQVCAKKSWKCSLYFYSESVIEIILMVINFILRRIPGRSRSISTCTCVTTWNRSVCSQADPKELIRSVTQHVSAYSGWPEELQRLINQLHVYNGRLTDFTQAQVLQGLGRGVDVHRFSSDSDYKKETILGLTEWAARVHVTRAIFLPQSDEADFFSCLFPQDTGWQRVQNSSVSGKALQRSSVGGLHDSSGVPLHW